MFAAMLVISVLALTEDRGAPNRGDVFVTGQDGYHTYRIPSVIVTKKGTVLAFCEGRKKGRSDTGDIDLIVKRSNDGGKTWGKTQIVWDDAGNTCGNPCPVIDRENGTIWMLMTHNLGEDNEARIIEGKSKGSRTVWVTNSTDDGETWSKPVEVTADTKLKDWTWYATGPGVGIQLKSGRLLIPCDNKVAGNKARQSHIIYSDDNGKTWKLGGIVGPNCNESQAVELSDANVLLNMRTYQANNRRLVAVSRDGGVTFSKPVEDSVLIEPVCQASIIRHPSEKNVILFSNPASNKREKMTIRISTDDCKTWAAAKVLHAGPAAYSSLTVLPDKTIGCLYECGTKDAYERIEFARFPLDWVSR